MRQVILAAGIAMGLSACSSVIHKPIVLDTDPATSLSVDGKQRLVIAVDRDSDRHRAICAEPSPDALVGIAASASAGVNVAGKGNVDLAASLAEAVQTVGRRTQTIQLLRDGLYRACEAYINGAISGNEYKLIISRVDDFAVTLMAIDGLTGGLNVPASALRPHTKGSVVKEGESPTGGGSVTAEASGGESPAAPPEIQVSAENGQQVSDIVQAFYRHQIAMAEEDRKTATMLHALNMEMRKQMLEERLLLPEKAPKKK